MPTRVRVLIDALGLAPHPERGFYAETYRAAGRVHGGVARSVAPGFEFSDFTLAEGPELEARYPAAADRIRRMRRPL